MMALIQGLICIGLHVTASTITISFDSDIKITAIIVNMATHEAFIVLFLSWGNEKTREMDDLGACGLVWLLDVNL